MNTFVARGTDYWQGGLELDPLRHGKQLVEVQQIHMALTSGGPAHILHHPATQMWLGHEQALLFYGLLTYDTYQAKYNRQHKSGEYIMRFREPVIVPAPDWVSDMAPHHRAKLWHKDKEHYARYYEPDLENESIYPVTKNGATCGWVRRHDKHWYLDALDSQGPRFKSAWDAIQYVRQFT